ncbi:MAG TPA: hypothetical protein VHC22_24120 [Pirellulales bacterium]|nr:hypothetical protein [Pirellulales bacterium]
MSSLHASISHESIEAFLDLIEPSIFGDVHAPVDDFDRLTIETAIRERILCALNAQAARACFGQRTPESIVAYATEAGGRDAAGRLKPTESLDGDPTLVHSTTMYRIGDEGLLAAPVAGQSLLVPAVTNVVMVERHTTRRDSVLLKLKFPRPIGKMIWPQIERNRLGIAVYAEPRSVRDWQAFRSLTDGIWRVCGHDRQAGSFVVEPGIGPVAQPLPGTEHAGIADMYQQLATCWAGRFFRLPVDDLLRWAHDETNLTCEVRVGTGEAESICETPAGWLWLNCLPLWNNIVCVQDPMILKSRGWPMRPTREVELLAHDARQPQDPISLLGCYCAATGTHFYDARLSLGQVDPLQLVEQVIGGDGQMRLRFRVDIDPGALFVKYLNPTDWGRVAITPGLDWARAGRGVHLLARTTRSPLVENSFLGGLATCTAPHLFPGAACDTDSAIERSVNAALPHTLRLELRRLGYHERSCILSIRTSTCLADNDEAQPTRQPIPCKQAVLVAPPSLSAADLNIYAAMIERRLSGRCLLPIRICFKAAPKALPQHRWKQPASANLGRNKS